jgi:hypothetical protein
VLEIRELIRRVQLGRARSAHLSRSTGQSHVGSRRGRGCDSPHRATGDPRSSTQGATLRQVARPGTGPAAPPADAVTPGSADDAPSSPAANLPFTSPSPGKSRLAQAMATRLVTPRRHAWGPRAGASGPARFPVKTSRLAHPATQSLNYRPAVALLRPAACHTGQGPRPRRRRSRRTAHSRDARHRLPEPVNRVRTTWSSTVRTSQAPRAGSGLRCRFSSGSGWSTSNRPSTRSLVSNDATSGLDGRCHVRSMGGKRPGSDSAIIR